MNKRDEIDKLLSNYEYLKCDLVYDRDLEFIQTIMSMPEWNDPKFQGLLTSNIWNSNAKDVQTILQCNLLKEEKYKHLLVPSIFNISLKNLFDTIELLKEYEIYEYITNRCIRRNVKLQKQLLDYMVKNNIDLLTKKKNGLYGLNPIINASNNDLKKKYGIDIKEIGKRSINNVR